MGTTIEILQAYPLGTLEVEVRYEDVPSTDRGTLISLSSIGPHVKVEFLEPRQTSGSVVVVLKPEECIPILYAFEDLCTPLEDGTVPAVEVARLAAGLKPGDPTPSVLYGSNSSPIMVATITGHIRIYASWNVQHREYNDSGALCQVESQAAIIDYLRSKHFAVGLTPDQFIRKTR